MSVYGSQLWDFDSKKCDKYFVAWRKCIRRLLNVPLKCHSDLLPLLCLDIPVQCQMHVRFLRFMNSCKQSANKIVNICINESLKNHMSFRCRSLSKICHVYGYDRSSECFDISRICSNFFTNIDDEKLANAFHIRELLYFKEKTCDKDVDAIIEFLCVS